MPAAQRTARQFFIRQFRQFNFDVPTRETVKLQRTKHKNGKPIRKMIIHNDDTTFRKHAPRDVCVETCGRVVFST